MKNLITLYILFFIVSNSQAQNSLQVTIRDSKTKEALSGVTVTINGTGKVSASNNKGFIALNNIADGKQIIVFSSAGYHKRIDSLDFPLLSKDTMEILMETEEDELEEVIVQSTRTSRTIKNTPTRVETIEGEEIDEKNNMRPANVSMLLHESTGLQVQQTSATSASASIRVQGLDGRYTQLLKDGYPNFGNFASGLSILEIPPLDLKQVEVIKGPASTLYGGGAIAGVVNFISATPKEEGIYNFLINQSNIGQTNAGVYASQKKAKVGYTILALVNFQKAYDVDNDDFSELPKSNNFTIHPQLFYYPGKNSSLVIGNSFTKGNSIGGDMHVIDGKSDNNHVYFEKNETIRNTTTIEFRKKLRDENNFTIKQSISYFDRKISSPGYVFAGASTNVYTDISYVVNKKNHTVIGGVNFLFDGFTQDQNTSLNNQDAKSYTGGGYVQDTWDISRRIKIESGLRWDNAWYSNINYHKSQSFLLPRISALIIITDKISSRIGGGLGYKIPTIFTEQTERLQYKDVLPLNNVKAEKSIGATADVNFKPTISDNFSLSINQLFFYTTIARPLVLDSNASGDYFFINAEEPVSSKGFETNIRLIYKRDLKLFIGYTYTYTKAGYLKGNQYLPLVPKDKLNLALVYEKENNFKIGLEAYLTGNQYLYNGTKTPSFWEFGAMAEKKIHKISLFINFENFTDQRQSKYKPVVNPPYNNPTFDDIWNHTEGFVVNGGIKIRL